MNSNKVTWSATPTLRITQLLHLEWWGGYSSGPTREVSREAATHSIAHINSYATEFNKTIGNATVLTGRVTGWWEPDQYAPSVTGDLVTPNRTDQLTGLSTQGAPEIVRSKIRRDTQIVRVERYVSGARATHNVRFGVQFEQAGNTQERAYPSGVRYFDLGGRPDYAIFRDPSVQGAAFTTQGIWGEDQLTLGNRLTLSLGLRFDRMHAISPDRPAVDNKLEPTGTTIEGLGSMFVWNVWAPRIGTNLKLTADGRTVLRGTYGRAYRPILLNEFDVLHPGIPTVTQANFDPATGGYTRVVSVTNARSNLAIDPNLAAPYTDSFSIGVDRQLLKEVAVNASYVYKHGENGTGWRDTGGIYGARTEVLSDGRTLTVFPLLNSPSQRLYLRTNRPEYVDDYKGLVVGLSKRMSGRWAGQINFTKSVSEGLRPTGGTFGRDPNDLINAVGRLSPTDRPTMLNANATYEIPVIDVRVSANYQNMSHQPFAPQALVSLPQGRRSVNIDVPGSFRPERISLLYLRVNKILLRQGSRRLELMANLVNALQSTAPGNNFFTFNYFSPNYAQPVSFVQPRQLYVGARMNF
jgi:hypothetical protein